MPELRADEGVREVSLGWDEEQSGLWVACSPLTLKNHPAGDSSSFSVVPSVPFPFLCLSTAPIPFKYSCLASANTSDASRTVRNVRADASRGSPTRCTTAPAPAGEDRASQEEEDERGRWLAEGLELKDDWSGAVS